MTRNHRAIVLLAITALIFITPVRASLQGSLATEINSLYPIIDSGVWAGTSDATADIYWVDNNRILFKTVKGNDKRMAYKGPFNLSIWEIGKGVTPYTPFAHKVSACLRDGIIRYTLEDERKNIKTFHGKFGEEKLIANPPKMTYYDFVNCRVEDNPEVAAKRKNDRIVNPLLDRHGYLDKGPAEKKDGSQDNPFVLFYRAGHQQPITLNIKSRDLKGAQYYEFKRAYFFQEIGVYQKHGEPAVVRWLFPDGRVEEEKIPVGAWARGSSLKSYPIARGIFIVSHDYKSGRDPGKAGGYLLKEGRFIKIIDGSIRGPVVSPDGCKIAFSHVLYNNADMAMGNDSTLRTLKLIDFCRERK